MIAVLALLLQVAPAGPVVVTATPKKERKICRELESTGSRLGGARDCRTASEWKAQQIELDARNLNAKDNMKGLGDGKIASDRPSIR